MSKLNLIALLSLFLVSCSNESSEIINNPDPEVSISSYQIDTKTIYTDPTIPSNQQITTGNLLEGKLFSLTTENFIGGVSQGGPFTLQNYFYSGNNVTKIIGENQIRNFYYDNQNRIIGASLNVNSNVTSNYYRIVYLPNNIVHFEKISGPYDDVTSQIIQRIILEYNSDFNITKAGRDNNFDGISENDNLFTYLNNNLVSSQKYNQNVVNYDYSSVVDNFSVLSQKTLGKLNSKLICSENYLSLYSLENSQQSKNLLSTTFFLETYDVLPNNYYSKKTKTENIDSGILTTITKFFFN